MLVLQDKVEGYNAKGIAKQYLKQLDHQWKEQYYDLKTRTLLPSSKVGEFMDTGKLWAG